MKFYKQYYAGIQQKEDSVNLSWLVPITGNSKKDELSLKKVDSWSSTYDWRTSSTTQGKSITLDNTPLAGYKIIGFSSRYSTSNKHIYVLHPQGFYFELSVETFVELIKDCTIEKGVIKDELVIYQHKGKNALTTVDSPIYEKLEFVGEKLVNIKDVNIGDKISIKKLSQLNNEVYYLGLHTIKGEVTIHYSQTDIDTINSYNEWVRWRGQYGLKLSNINVNNYKEVAECTLVTNFTSEPKHIFLVIDEKGRKSYEYMNEKSKFSIVSVNGSSDHKLDTNHLLNNHWELYRLNAYKYINYSVFGDKIKNLNNDHQQRCESVPTYEYISKIY